MLENILSMFNFFKHKPKPEPIIIHDKIGNFTSSKFGKDGMFTDHGLGFSANISGKILSCI